MQWHRIRKDGEPMDYLIEAERLVKTLDSDLSKHLSEQQRRLLMGSLAKLLGHGGVRFVSDVVEVAHNTVSRGFREVQQLKELAPEDRVRMPGGGRKKAEEKQPELLAILDTLIEPGTRGDPESPLRWTIQSTRQLADALKQLGLDVSHDVVGRLLNEMDYSLQGNAKTEEGKQHEDRNAQFEHINELSKEFRDAGDPVISVDTKKKELVGNFKNAGQTWQKKGKPVRVNDHDFPDRALGKAIPYGVYDVALNAGWVNVGQDHDTAQFAVQSIRNWWRSMGSCVYQNRKRLLICADAGGSNGYRLRLWKSELAAFAAETGLTISVCHFPPGTSKWNKIEHRLFSQITMNWRGKPLTSYETVVELIGSTTTRTGLLVRSELDEGTYPLKIKVPRKEFAKIPISKDDFCGAWNYTISPSPQPKT